MSSFKDLEIYDQAFKLALEIHKLTFQLPKHELYEQGSQIRRSSKSIKDNIAEGYGRRRYKAEYVRYLTFAQASCDEVHSQLDMLVKIYPDIREFPGLVKECEAIGRKIFNYILYVEKNWKT